MNNAFIGALTQLIGMGNNPQQILNNVLMRNPNFQNVFNQVRSSGLSQKDFTLQYARQNGIDIQPILNTLSQMGIKL